MIKFHHTKTQISPCIVSKAKFFLKLKEVKPNNTKSCSKNYWERTIDTLSILHKIDDSIKSYAKDSFPDAIK